jgi:hypothetical protein
VSQILNEIAKELGVNPAILEGSGLTLALLAILYMARTLFASQKSEGVQVSFEKQLVTMTADAVEESKKLRVAYENNTEAIKANVEVLKELVTTAKDLKNDLPAQLAKHDETIATMFMNKADEMHKITERRDSEAVQDRQSHDNNHKEIIERLNELKKEITDATDDTTLRSAINKILLALDKFTNDTKVVTQE